ncbi:MAG: DUF6340 family protein [Bacteroidota bacterium]
MPKNGAREKEIKASRNLYMLVLLALLVVHGCASIFSVVDFEVLEPATVSLPENVNQLIILNRAPYTLDSFKEEDRKGMGGEQLIVLDTLIVNSMNRGLLDVLRQSPVERFHHPYWIADRRMDTSSMENLILTKREVDALCREMKADAILSLESYSMDFNQKGYYFLDAPGVPMTKYYEVSDKVSWMIYLPGSPKPFDTYTLADTLFFTEILDGEIVNNFTAATMIQETFYHSGARYGRYLVPVWVHTSRSLFKGRDDSLKQAAKLTDLGDWDKAYSIWKKLTESKDSTLVSKAYHNMAVFYELEDNLDSANLFISRAMEYDPLDAVKAYQEEMEMRMLNRGELYKQVR